MIERGDSIRARFTFELAPASTKFTDTIEHLKKKRCDATGTSIVFLYCIC
jgi:hypothetical protein